jgi:hypothetical protein
LADDRSGAVVLQRFNLEQVAQGGAIGRGASRGPQWLASDGLVEGHGSADRDESGVARRIGRRHSGGSAEGKEEQRQSEMSARGTRKAWQGRHKTTLTTWSGSFKPEGREES